MGNDCFLASQLAAQDTSTPDYSFAGCVFLAKIVDVYDGDTCTAVVKINSRFQKIKVRLNGIDTPEMKPSKDAPDREATIAKAVQAKNALMALIYQKVVRMIIHDFDKYGRFLATIYQRNMFSEVNVNEYMLAHGYGYRYDGGKKRSAGGAREEESSGRKRNNRNRENDYQSP